MCLRKHGCTVFAFTCMFVCKDAYRESKKKTGSSNHTGKISTQLCLCVLILNIMPWAQVLYVSLVRSRVDPV